jgi:hypothetical protein
MVNFKTFHKQPVDGKHLLLVVRGGAPTPGWNVQPELLYWNESDLLGIFLMAAEDPNLVWELAVMPGPEYGGLASVARADNDTIVFRMTYTDYGLPRPWLKVFFDVGSKRTTGRKWYTPPAVSAIAVIDQDAFFVAESEPRPLVFRLSGDDARLVEGEELTRIGGSRIEGIEVRQIGEWRFRRYHSVRDLTLRARGRMPLRELPR